KRHPHEYSLEEFGLTPSRVLGELGDYVRDYGIAMEGPDGAIRVGHGVSLTGSGAVLRPASPRFGKAPDEAAAVAALRSRLPKPDEPATDERDEPERDR